jgi:hypothetical protein
MVQEGGSGNNNGPTTGGKRRILTTRSLILAFNIAVGSPSFGWPIEFVGQKPSTIQIAVDCDMTYESRQSFSAMTSAMKEVAVSEHDKMAFFPFAKASEMIVLPDPGLLFSDRTGGQVLLRSVRNKNGYNCAVYVLAPTSGQTKSVIGPAPPELIASNSVQTAVVRAVRQGVSRCQGFQRGNSRAAERGEFPPYDPSVLWFCFAPEQTSPDVQPSFVALATMVAQIKTGNENYVLVMNQDFIILTKSE